MDRLLRFSYICPAHVYNSHCAAAAGWHLREENDEKEGEREKEGGRLVRRRERETRGYASTKREGSGLWWEGGERGRGVEGWERIGRVGGLERVRGHGSYGIALTFDLIPLPASLETPCRPLPSVPRAPTLLRNRLECETLATDRESSRPGNIRKGGAERKCGFFFANFRRCACVSCVLLVRRVSGADACVASGTWYWIMTRRTESAY